MSLIDLSEIRTYNPLDIVERLATSRDWAFDRHDDEVTLVVSGDWAEYQLSFTWMGDIEAMHLACAFDLKGPSLRRSEIVELIAKVNEQLWVGHFDFWEKDGLIMFRQALILAGGSSASDDQCEALLGTAVQACLPVRGLGRQERARRARCELVRDHRPRVISLGRMG